MVKVFIDVLVEINDVTPVFMYELGHLGYEAWLVGAVNQKNCAIGHGKLV